MTKTDDLVDDLWNVELIKRLKGRYFEHLDRQEWTALSALFTPEATFELQVPDGWVRFDNRAKWLENLQAMLNGGWTVHHGHTPVIDVDGSTATGTWAMFDEVHPGPATGRLPFKGYGHYAETYRCEAGKWVITSLRLTRLYVGDLVPPNS